MLFNRLRRRKKNIDKERPYEDGYAPLADAVEDDKTGENRELFRGQRAEETNNFVRRRYNDPRRTYSGQHRAVELCEELIDTARDLEDERAEYELLTSYLNDIQKLETMPEGQLEPIVDSARQIIKLDSTRNQFLNAEHRLSDAQFAQFQEEEDELPGTIKRLQSNETYLDAIKRDMHMLEGEKVEWVMLLQEQKEQQQLLRKVSLGIMVLFALAVVSLILLSQAFSFDTQLAMLVTAFLAVAYAAFAIWKYQDTVKEIKRCEANRNKAITLENHVKIKYVNIKNAVDYTYEKYHVKNSYELIYQYEQYQEMVKEKQRFRQTSDDLIYYSERLVKQLESHNLYDARIWLRYVNELIDKKEMVELKHNLIVKRQHVREQMEEQASNIRFLRDEIEITAYKDGEHMQQIQKILKKIDELNIAKI